MVNGVKRDTLLYYIKDHSVAKPTRIPSLNRFAAQIKKQGYRYTLSKLIMETHKEGSNLLIAVVADPRSIHKRGVGKSVYALRVLIDVYKTWMWDKLRKYIVFMPQDFLRLLETIIKRDKINPDYPLANEERLPLIVWDDAGFWLNKQRWMNKFVVAVRENLNVIRTAVTAIIFTAPTWGELARGIRDHIDILVLITRNNDRESIARGYKIIQGVFEDYRRETLFQDYFNIMLPNEIYQPYDKYRRSYVLVGLERMKKNLEKILEGEETRQVPPDVLAENLDISDLKELWGY